MSFTPGYSTRDIAKMLDLSADRVRSWARSGLIEPRRGSRNEYRFSFQDLVLLRTARELMARRIPARKVRRALTRLREQLPRGRSLAELSICAAGDEIVVRSRGTSWNPESGQAHFDFDVSDLARKVAPLARRAARAAHQGSAAVSADDWFELGCDLEGTDPDEARAAYARSLAQNPDHADAHLNLGRLRHAAGDAAAAEEHYRLALASRPDDPTGLFNLAVALEDLGRPADAMAAYKRALFVDGNFADAHFNLAYLYEKQGNRTLALQHFNSYRRLLRHIT